MKAIANVLPHSPQYGESVIAKDQPPYVPLPCVRLEYIDSTHTVVSCYKLTWTERLRLLFVGKLWSEQMVFPPVLEFGRRLQPQRLTVYEPLTAADQPKTTKQ